jgi:hypothetical protein
MLASVLDSPGSSSGVGQFSGIMVPDDNNYLYSIGMRLEYAAFNRIVVVRFDKDLTKPVISQDRPFNASSNVDVPSGAALSPDGGPLYVGGVLDAVSINPQGVMIKVDLTTGNMVNNINSSFKRIKDMAFASGMLYGLISPTGPVKVDKLIRIVWP